MTGYRKLEEFNTDKGEVSGGATGSKKVKGNDNQDYQFKPSIHHASIFRKARTGNLMNPPDTELFVELIASRVGKIVLKSDDAPELVPEVQLVFDSKKKDMAIVSRYLQNVEGTLEDYTFSNKGSGDENSTKKMEYIREDIANALALSALSGDHDVNAGNMLVIKDSQKNLRIARIDLGQAFNNLIRLSERVGGQVANKENPMLDFFNRETIPHIMSSGRETKLWAQGGYNVVPSKELVSALRKIGNSSSILEGLQDAKQPIKELIDDLQKDEKNNKQALQHIKHSLIALNDNIGEKVSSDLDIQQVLDSTFIQGFYERNQRQMLDVAKLMEVQIKVDELIVAKKEGKDISPDLVKDIKKEYDQLKEISGIGSDKGVKWIKSSRNIKEVEDTLDNFIKRRAERHGIIVPEGVNTIEDFANSRQQTSPILESIINETAIISTFLDVSAQRYIEHKSKQDKNEFTKEQAQKATMGDLQNLLYILDLKAEGQSNSKELISKLKSNLPEYVEEMDRKFTEGRKEILTREGVDIKKASLGELHEAMQQFSLNNPYKDISRKLREKQLIEQTSDTIWKWFASACGSIGMSNLKNYFIEKDTKAKTAIIAQKLGLKINTVKSLVTKGNKQFAQESVNKNKSKSSEHQH